ncbi:glycoside hydrolase family 95 protein [Hufsiella ginkgonis]|uniref:Glycoside hydrolase family 95 protein n=1 Tax=Hufsiella ginkgonis TaxID=2695274 RepID=A0A7K1XWP5_9SPHI|nr:glycoside hydrolase N-terminal domain-containing protein [Hufsiella ginkgonis]MXV15189.1 glycoside hydrolase family 95 protein [Hufsiella ginkgonis]
MNRKCIVLAACLLTAAQAFSQDLKLWYAAPADPAVWTDALPIGNGRMGGMVFGGVRRDRIQFNEETLWSGAPRDYNRQGAYRYLPQIRQLLFDGKQKEAEELAEKRFMGAQSPAGDREAWLRRVRALKGLNGNPALPGYNDDAWKEMPVPAYEGWETAGFEGLDGAVWFRTTFNLPGSWNGKDLVLDLNRIRELDFTYVNGKLIGSTNSPDPRKYIVPATALVKGRNVIAIQVINYFDKGGIAGYKDTTRHIGIYPGTDPKQAISLVKPWKYLVQDSDPPAIARYQADYQPFGDLTLNFPGHEKEERYRRELDLERAIVTTSYTAGGVGYRREYFASQPGDALVVHLAADQPGKISFRASLGSPHRGATVTRIDAHTIALSLNVKHGALKGVSHLRVKLNGGKITASGNELVISGANEATLYLTAATNFRSYRDVSANANEISRIALEKITARSYETVKQAHVQDYQRYFNTFSIRLGTDTASATPTNLRLLSFSKRPDPSFAALYVQYGRYLLISSSRPGTQAANLQGIWNDLLAPPWGSKYTTNVNLEMNYWPAEVLNLSPMHEPLFNLTEDLVKTGTETAKQYYNAPGWVLHHNTDLWRGTAPINASNHGIWVSGAAWLSHHFWEHYLFTQDETFLRARAYPVMRSAARFYNSFLVKDPKTGWLVSTPSNSPENGGLVAGPAMDHQLIRDLFKNTIEASKILETDAKFRDSLQKKMPMIAPNQVGRAGQLQEWLEDKDDTASTHRHVSHLWGVFPGNEINWDESAKLMHAARQSLLFRGDEGTGWSLAWKINYWARFKDGAHAFNLLKMLLRPARSIGGSYLNLFDAHPPFQIDGNFGGAAGIAEMLVQSQMSYIDLLPALPPEIPDGEIKGLCARGGFVVNLSWKKGKLVSTEVFSKAGNKCILKYGSQVQDFSTEKGKSYITNW